jgi:hypothetical protein
MAPFPGPVLELDADAGVLKPLEHGDCHFVAETIPKLKPVERLHRRLRFMAKRVEGQAPDDSAVLR